MGEACRHDAGGDPGEGVFPYLPLPHPVHEVGGMVFPDMVLKELPRLKRFDMDFDIPEWFLP